MRILTQNKDSALPDIQNWDDTNEGLEDDRTPPEFDVLPPENDSISERLDRLGFVEARFSAPVTTALPTLAESLEAFLDALDLRYFSGAEFTPYWTRTCGGETENRVPPRVLWKSIVPTLVVLDRFRHEMGSPVRLLSTYRSPSYNACIGGEENSFHTQFRAIDFACATGTPVRWATKLKSYRGKRFTLPQSVGGGTFLFRGGIGTYPTRGFVHIDTRGYDANWAG